MNSSEKQIIRAFRMKGLSIQSDALLALSNVLRREPPQQFQTTLGNIINQIKERFLLKKQQPSTTTPSSITASSSSSSSQVVTVHLIAQVVAELSRDSNDIIDEALQLLDAVHTPRLDYDPMKKKFQLVKSSSNSISSNKGNGESRSFLGNPMSKIDMLLQRYESIYQRMMRQDSFKPNLRTVGIGGSGAGPNSTYKISSIEALLGRTGLKTLLGIIVQIEEGHYYLEDPTGNILMDLSQTELLSDGFYTEHSIVLVEGEVIDDIFHVHKMGQPIFEPRSDSIQAIGIQNTDIFDAIPTLSELSLLRQQEIQHGLDGMFVILSDVHLDDPRVLEKLEILFDGYQDFTPMPVFIFMGNFASKYHFQSSSTSVMMGGGNATVTSYFDDLANVIAKFPKVANHARFVLIPGPNDPGLGSVLPRPPIPSIFTKTLCSKVRHMHIASNPCRIRYFSKEFVLSRLDVLNKLRRNSILPPLDDDLHTNSKDDSMDGDDSSSSTQSSTQVEKNPMQNLIKHGVKTIMDQGHLCPVPPHECPIYWEFDHVMRLYPCPDLLVLGDSGAAQYDEIYGQCDVLNPGPFHLDFAFLVYRPFVRARDGEIRSNVEICQIDS